VLAVSVFSQVQVRALSTGSWDHIISPVSSLAQSENTEFFTTSAELNALIAPPTSQCIWRKPLGHQ
jgi:hypothetical protein